MLGRYVTMHHLVFTGVQIELPASIVAFRIRVEPPGERKAEIDETAKRTNWPFRSDHNIGGGAAGHRVWSDIASHSRVAETVHGFELDDAPDLFVVPAKNLWPGPSTNRSEERRVG